MTVLGEYLDFESGTYVWLANGERLFVAQHHMHPIDALDFLWGEGPIDRVVICVIGTARHLDEHKPDEQVRLVVEATSAGMASMSINSTGTVMAQDNEPTGAIPDALNVIFGRSA